jgi:serine/threonine protein kinase
MTDEQLYGGRYQLLDVIGDGGMARVFRATDQRLDRTVAVKILREQFTSEPQFIERFRQEARLAAGLAHPNIVGVFDVGEEGGHHYIVMEYVAGENLKQVITREAPLPLGTVIGFMRQLAAALDYAHAHGVIHRDIKPENILVTDKREVKVGDFGIARALAGTALTATGTVLGSVSYFSPEQASGQPASAESDLYAAGIVLYELLTAHVPFSGPNPVAVAMAQVNDSPPLPTSFVPALPRAVEAVVLKAIAKDPSQRFHSGYDLIAALTAAARTAGPPAAAVAETVPPRGAAASAAAATMIAPGPAVASPAVSGPRRGNMGAVIALVSTLVLLAAALLVFRGLSGGSSSTGGATSTPTPRLTATAAAKGTAGPPTLVPIVVPTQSGPATATFILPPDSPTRVPSATPVPTATLPPATATPALTATQAPSAGTGTPGDTTPTNVPGTSHGATVDMVMAAAVGTHYVPVDVKSDFAGGTNAVYAVARVHGKAKGDTVAFTWHYPDGSTFAYQITDVTDLKGDFPAYARLIPRGPGTYTVTASINGANLASASFTVSAAVASATVASGAATTSPQAGAASPVDTETPPAITLTPVDTATPASQ